MMTQSQKNSRWKWRNHPFGLHVYGWILRTRTFHFHLIPLLFYFSSISRIYDGRTSLPYIETFIAFSLRSTHAYIYVIYSCLFGWSAMSISIRSHRVNLHDPSNRLIIYSPIKMRYQITMHTGHSFQRPNVKMRTKKKTHIFNVGKKRNNQRDRQRAKERNKKKKNIIKKETHKPIYKERHKQTKYIYIPNELGTR